MPELRFKIAPHPQQIKFMNAAEREQLFGGAKRGGKSVALCQKIIALSIAFPGNRGLLCRQNLTDLKDSTLVTFFQVCPSSLIARHHLGDRMITFTNGSYFIYRGVGDEDELEKVKGIDLGWLAIDEPSEIEESTYLMLIAQFNWRLPDGSRPAYMSLLACNPEPGWVKKRFVDVQRPDRIFIPSLAKDNPGLPSDYIDYLRANFPEEWVIKYVDGSWEISEGMVYKEFSREINVLHTMPSLKGMHIYGSLDPAPASITGKVDLAIDYDYNHYVIWEYYRSERMLRDHAREIMDRISWYKVNGYQYDYTLIDPASSQRTNVKSDDNRLQSIRELYQEEGLFTIPAWNALEGGIERVKWLIHSDPHHAHPITGVLGAPRLYVLSPCSNTIDEFLGWQRRLQSNGQIEYKGADHAIDNVRYIINSRPKPPIMSGMDEMNLSPLTRHAARSHKSWSEKWDREIRRQSGEGQGYFDYLGGSSAPTTR